MQRAVVPLLDVVLYFVFAPFFVIVPYMLAIPRCDRFRAGLDLHDPAIEASGLRLIAWGVVLASAMFLVHAVYDPRSPLTWLRAMGRRDTYVFAWMIACIAGLPHWVVAHGAVIAAANLAVLLAHLAITARRRAA